MKKTMIALAIATLALGACSDQDADDRAGSGAAKQQAPATTTSTTSEQSAGMADKAAAVGSKAWEATRETVSDATEKTGKVVAEVKEKAVQTYDQVKQKASEVVAATKDKVGGMLEQQQPVTPPQMPAMPQQQ